jgi:ribose transport system permease protein
MPYQQVPLEQVHRVAWGFNGPEGVAFDQQGNLYGGGVDGVIRKLTPDGAVSDFASVGGRPAGLAFDREDNLFVCEPVSGAVLKITHAGDVSVFAEWVGDFRLRIPNFLTFDAEGILYVSNSTDRPIAEERADGMRPSPRGSLVRLMPNGNGEVVATGLYLANGTAIDPREEYVYVLQSTRNNCVRIAINQDGTHGEVEPHGEDLGALPDGMAFDADGHLIVTLPQVNRLVVLDPEGTRSTLIDDPAGEKTEEPTNCAFGGVEHDELYIAHLHADYVGTVALGRKGHLLYNLR